MTNYATAKLLIKRKRTDGLAEKLSKLYLFGELTKEQYDELMAELGIKGSEGATNDV